MMGRPAVAEKVVLEGTRRALERYGWEGMTAERVAAEAGVARATLHRRGLTKERLLELLADEATALYRDAMWPVLTGEGSGKERLEQALATLCQLAEEHMAVLLALDAQANAAVFHDAAEAEQLTRTVFTEPLERLLRDGVADRSLRDSNPVETATVLFNLVGWTYIHLRSGHGWNAERARGATLEVALRGVVAGGP
jgi:AcrR family transcriptional regulator